MCPVMSCDTSKGCVCWRPENGWAVNQNPVSRRLHPTTRYIPFFRTKKQITKKKKKLNLDSEGEVDLICKNLLYAQVFIVIKNSLVNTWYASSTIWSVSKILWSGLILIDRPYETDMINFFTWQRKKLNTEDQDSLCKGLQRTAQWQRQSLSPSKTGL